MTAWRELSLQQRAAAVVLLALFYGAIAAACWFVAGLNVDFLLDLSWRDRRLSERSLATLLCAVFLFQGALYWVAKLGRWLRELGE